MPARECRRGLGRALCALVFAGVAPVAVAEVVVVDRARTYDVAGRTADALQHDLDHNGPVAAAGHRVQAMTASELSWSLVQEPGPDTCVATLQQVELVVTTILPHWTEREAAPAPLRRRWDALRATLVEHEAGHRRMAIDAARALEAELAALPPGPDCKRQFREAQRRADRVRHRLVIQDIRYDRRTRFGLHQDRAL